MPQGCALDSLGHRIADQCRGRPARRDRRVGHTIGRLAPLRESFEAVDKRRIPRNSQVGRACRRHVLLDRFRVINEPSKLLLFQVAALSEVL